MSCPSEVVPRLPLDGGGGGGGGGGGDRVQRSVHDDVFFFVVFCPLTDE